MVPTQRAAAGVVEGEGGGAVVVHLHQHQHNLHQHRHHHLCQGDPTCKALISSNNSHSHSQCRIILLLAVPLLLSRG